MKKFLALSLTAALFCTAFAGCSSKNNYESGDVVPMVDGDAVVVTEEGGEVARKENGKIVVVVTNPDGQALKDENGNEVTSAVDLTHAVVLGDKIEYSLFSVTVTDGWNAGNVHDTVVINSKDKDETNKIVIYSEKKIDDNGEAMPGEKWFNVVKGSSDVKIDKSESAEITVAGVKAHRQVLHISSEKIETKVLAYYTFESDDANFGVLCYSKKAGTSEKTFEDVINTMTLY